MINIVTNVSLYDGIRIKYTIPNWIRIFDKRIKSLRIVIDEKPVEGRIKSIHSNNKNIYELDEVISELLFNYPFIKIEKLNYNDTENISSKFFKHGNPIRCQAGTPIFAFLKGIFSSEEGIILRTDCDIIYYDNGWVNKALELLSENKYLIVEPPMLGQIEYGFSTRSFLIDKNQFMGKMPINAYKLDILRRIRRALKKRSSYLAFEQMIQKEIHRNFLSHVRIDNNLGFAIHFIYPEDFNNDYIEEIINRIENNSLPNKQKLDCDFRKTYWEYS